MSMFEDSFGGDDLLPFMTLLLVTVVFTAYWFLFSSQKMAAWFENRYSGDEGKIKHILFTKYLGLFLLGVIPAIVFWVMYPEDYSPWKLGLRLITETNILSIMWILGLGLPILVLNWFAARRPKTFSMYPQIRVKEWDRSLIVRYSMAWCAYLLGYEFLFRGVLFFPLVDSIGVWPAIAVNIALYVTTHIPKGLDESIGAGPLGLVLCLITLHTGTIWVAFMVHVFLALSNSLFALKFHPEFVVVKQRTS